VEPWVGHGWTLGGPWVGSPGTHPGRTMGAHATAKSKACVWRYCSCTADSGLTL
jgi:hypothetical protein